MVVAMEAVAASVAVGQIDEESKTGAERKTRRKTGKTGKPEKQKAERESKCRRKF